MAIQRTYPATSTSPAEYRAGNPVRCVACGITWDWDDEQDMFHDPEGQSGELKGKVVCREKDCVKWFLERFPREYGEMFPEEEG